MSSGELFVTAAQDGDLDEVRRLLKDEVKDVNVTYVSCVHQPELTLLFGWCMSGVYSQLVYYHCDDDVGVLSVSTVFVDYTYGLLRGCVALPLPITAVQCARE